MFAARSVSSPLRSAHRSRRRQGLLMAEDSELRRDLLMRIEARRAAVQVFLRENRPRIRRRANATIVLSSLAAAFTAGPALGGETFADSVQRSLGLVTNSIVWQLLCL